jgi:hypothetical protein
MIAEEDSKVYQQAVNQINAFAKGFKVQVKEDIEELRELREDEVMKEKARRQADDREREDRIKKQRQEEENARQHREKELKPDIKDDDSDLEDFIDTDPWAKANKETCSPTKMDEEDLNNEGKPSTSSESPKRSEPTPALIIKQTKLKPKKN